MNTTRCFVSIVLYDVCGTLLNTTVIVLRRMRVTKGEGRLAARPPGVVKVCKEILQKRKEAALDRLAFGQHSKVEVAHIK